MSAGDLQYPCLPCSAGEALQHGGPAQLTVCCDFQDFHHGEQRSAHSNDQEELRWHIRRQEGNLPIKTLNDTGSLF